MSQRWIIYVSTLVAVIAAVALVWFLIAERVA